MSTSTSPAGDGKSTDRTSATDVSNGAGSRSIFDDPAISASGKDDPFVRWVSQYWKQALGGLVAVALAIIAYDRVTATWTLQREQATHIFNDLRSQYSTLVTKQDELRNLEGSLASQDEAQKAATTTSIDNLKKEIDDLWSKMKLRAEALESPEPFDTLARLYKGLGSARMGDYDAARAALDATQWQSVGRAGSSERFTAELAALGLARSLIDSESHRATAKETLVALAERSDAAAVGAVTALASLAESEEEKEKVRNLIDGIKQRQPAQSLFLTEASERVV